MRQHGAENPEDFLERAEACLCLLFGFSGLFYSYLTYMNNNIYGDYVMLKLLNFAFFAAFIFAAVPSVKAAESLSGSISFSGAWALYPMVVKWAEEFRKINPNLKIDIAAGGAGKGVADALAGAVDMGMVSRDIQPAEIQKGAWQIAVAKDAVVPVMNAKNPLASRIISSGIKQDIFKSLWISGKKLTWGNLCGAANQRSVNVYTRSDACGAAEIWAKFLNGKQEDLEGVGVYGDPGLAEAVKKDVFGIGYNNIGYAYDAKTKKPIEGLAVIPLDVNSDGKISPEENFYGDRDSLMKAVADGRYPSPPSRNLFLVAKGKPEKKQVVAFLKWILTDGQKFTAEAGYVSPSEDILKAELKKLE